MGLEREAAPSRKLDMTGKAAPEARPKFAELLMSTVFRLTHAVRALHALAAALAR